MRLFLWASVWWDPVWINCDTALVPDVGSDSQNSLEQSYKSAFWVNFKGWYQPVGRMLEHMQGFIGYQADLWPRLPLVWFWGRSFSRLCSVCKDSFWLWILCFCQTVLWCRRCSGCCSVRSALKQSRSPKSGLFLLNLIACWLSV